MQTKWTATKPSLFDLILNLKYYIYFLFIVKMWLDFGKPTKLSLGLFHFIGPANGYTCILHIHSAIIRLDWLVCYSRVTFANSVNSWLRQRDPLSALHGRHGSEIHPRDRETSITPFKHVWVWLALLRLIASPNSPNGWFSLPPASHLPHPLLPAHPL